MITPIRTYARDMEGNVMKYDVTDIASFKDAIDAVKKETGAQHVLCVVPQTTKEASQPVTAKEAA